MLGRRTERALMEKLWFSCLRQALVRIFPSKPWPCGDIEIVGNGLNQDVRVGQWGLEIMGQAVIWLIQFLCGYFGCKLAGWLGQTKGHSAPHATRSCIVDYVVWNRISHKVVWGGVLLFLLNYTFFHFPSSIPSLLIHISDYFLRIRTMFITLIV